jgi:hypothetical protein
LPSAFVAKKSLSFAHRIAQTRARQRLWADADDDKLTFVHRS